MHLPEQVIVENTGAFVIVYLSAKKPPNQQRLDFDMARDGCVGMDIRQRRCPVREIPHRR